MIKQMDNTANEALSTLVKNLARNKDAKQNRVELQKWIESLDAPITYSNEDIDRASNFAEWLQSLMMED